MELLAPGGVKAASVKRIMEAGADALYVGLRADAAPVGQDRAFLNLKPDRYGLRLSDVESLLHECSRAGKRLYVTVNNLIGERAFGAAMEQIAELDRLGVHGLILGDLGLIRASKRRHPDLKVIASIITSTCNASMARFLRDIGVSRVILERNLAIDEIKKIKEKSGLEVEVFVHGQLCYSYFRFCNLSPYLNGIACEGPCFDRFATDPSTGIPPKGYLLRSKLLNVVQLLPRLLEAGVDGVKIEGRSKRPAYIAEITRAFRRAIDRAVTGCPLEVDQTLNGDEAKTGTSVFFDGALPDNASILWDDRLAWKLAVARPYLTREAIGMRIRQKARRRRGSE